MIDEVTLVRDLVDEPPERDELAMRRARQRLRDAIENETASAGEPSGHAGGASPRGALQWVAALVALVAVAFGLQLVLPAGRGGPSGSAAEELNHLGQVAAARPAITIPPGRVLYSQEVGVVEEAHSELGSASYSVLVNRTRDSWLAADGSVKRSTAIQSVAFASAADEAAWRAAGSPPLPPVGTTNESYGPGELKVFDLDGLPTDPAPLMEAIESGRAGAAPEGDAALFESVGTLLGQGNASPALRQGLFEVAAGIEGVAVDQSATDRLGRQGVGLSLSRDGVLTELVVDPSTSQLLAVEIRGADGSLEQSLDYSTPVIVPANSR